MITYKFFSDYVNVFCLKCLVDKKYAYSLSKTNNAMNIQGDMH